MRRTLIAVPVVFAVGVGGYYVVHHASAPVTASHPVPAMIRTHDGRVVPGPPATPSAATIDSAVATSAASSTPALPSTVAPAGATLDPTSPTGAAPLASVPPPPERDFARHAHPRNAGSNGEPPALPVPLPGVAKMRAKLEARTACDGPEAAQHYATLKGQERLDFAATCRRAGITLPP